MQVELRDDYVDGLIDTRNRLLRLRENADIEDVSVAVIDLLDAILPIDASTGQRK